MCPLSCEQTHAVAPLEPLIYHLLSDGTFYEEGRYAHVGSQQQERERKRAIKMLERLGYSVTVEKVA